MREVFLESYRELLGTELRIESIHAGLECGLFAEALPSTGWTPSPWVRP